MTLHEGAVRIEFDDIIYALQEFGGISQYWQELTGGIEAREDFMVARCTARNWQRLFYARSQAQIFHSSYFRVAKGRGVRNVITVHDMAWELGHVGNGPRRHAACLERRRAYHAADVLICVSESTRRDLLALFPSLPSRSFVTVIHHGPTLAADAAGAALDDSVHPALGRPFVLFVGGRGHYKNFDGALAGFAASGLAAEGIILVCTGKPLSSDEAALIRHYALNGHVVSLGAVSRATLVSLYRFAHCLLYPSRFEGFGMPVLEAMTLGCPVIAADCTSIPEITGGAAMLFDDGDVAGIARALRSLEHDTVRQRQIDQGRLRAAEFSWARSIDAHAQVYRCLSGKAVISTAPPTAAGELPC